MTSSHRTTSLNHPQTPPRPLLPSKMSAPGEALPRVGPASLCEMNGGGRDEDEEEEGGHNLWLSILSEVSSRSRSKLPTGRNVVVLGEDGSGKTSLVAKLQGVEEARKGRGLEYLYLSVHDEDRDDHARCNVWVLDGDEYHSGLLRFAMTRESARDSLTLLVADLARPWLIVDALHKWSGVLRRHLDSLKIPVDERRDMDNKLVREFQSYVEPETEESSPLRKSGSGALQASTPPSAALLSQGSGTSPGGLSGDEEADECVVLPLGENTFTHNLGVPVIVVCTKSDAVSTLEKEYDYREEHFDFIQSHVRRFCLRYGAALVYTSLKEDKNVDLLHKYLLHRLYGSPFCTPALVLERDAVFIPAGWDNDKKIGILHENFTSVRPEDQYEDIIIKPPVRKWVQEKEVCAEDEQVFLMKQQSLLVKQSPSPSGRPADAGQRVPGGSPRASTRPVASNVASVSPISVGNKKLDPANVKGGGTSEGVLANFFNSLLTKKAGSPVGAGGGSGGPGSSPGTTKKHGPKPALTDVQAELDRMARKSESTSVLAATNFDDAAS
ncbi:cytoplasmic dynein 1 light intermediate chain 1-like isoform X1 [Petromyzon marinus]|uniref:cytoplasmic dynein 1 light intermediate chain 1-like isoform X1 n=1 Tax=Petromyzon marinus TaxID=7757 RepID=UPI003F71BD09